MLPKISLAGTDFYIDIRLGELRQVERWHNKNNLDSLATSADGGHLLVFFDKRSKRQDTNR